MAKAKPNKLVFEDAEKARDSITSQQYKEIAALYEQWASDIAKKAEKFANKTNPSAPLSKRYLEELKKQLEASRDETLKKVESTIKSSMQTVADSVVKSNVDWLSGLGFPKSGLNAAFSNVPMDTVDKLVTGKLYRGGWNLSKAIWGDSEKTMSEAYKIVAGGLAKQQSVYEIAKDLEQFISPSAKKKWNLKDADGRMIYPKSVDYSAQRLARTLTQHAYQHSFRETTRDNPFITKYRWVSNGSRACKICKERDGKIYDKDKLPMDHPNGMCTMVPVVMDEDEMLDELAAWVKGEGDYPEIDKFAKKFGYEPSVKKNVSKATEKPSKAASATKKQTSAAKAQAAAEKVAEPARQVVDGKNIVTTWQRREGKFDFAIEDTMDAQGFDGLPRIVDAKEFGETVKKSRFIAQRSYSAPTQEILDSYRDMLYNGKWYVDCSTGGAQYGQGMYCAANWEGKLTDGIKAEMKHYSDLNVERSREVAWLDKLGGTELDDMNSLMYSLSGKQLTEDEWRVFKTLKQDVNKTAKDLTESDREIWQGMQKSKKLISANNALSRMQKEFNSEYKGFTYVETLTLDPSAKVITYNDLLKEYENRKQDLGEMFDPFAKEELSKSGITGKEANDAIKYLRASLGLGGVSDNAASNAYARLTKEGIAAANKLYSLMKDKVSDNMDIGAYAVLKGYDAINAEGHGDSGSYTVILNRTKLIIKRPE